MLHHAVVVTAFTITVFVDHRGACVAYGAAAGAQQLPPTSICWLNPADIAAKGQEQAKRRFLPPSLITVVQTLADFVG